MSTPKQRVWNTATESYHDGPDLVADQNAFPKYCLGDTVSKVNRSKAHPTTTSNNLYRHTRYQATSHLEPVVSRFAGFRDGGVSSPLWLTTYPFMAHPDNGLSGDTVLFHVHLSTDAIAEPVALGWVPFLFPGLGADAPEVSSWSTPITELQIAPTYTPDDDAIDNFGAEPTVVVNEGPILRSSLDILYLDKSFWRHYFDRYNRDLDILVPGVNPNDLSQIQKVAIDIAVLRNRDEFAAVARAVARHLPNATSFSAVVTKIIPRVEDGPEQQIALLEYGLPEVLISFEEKIRLGIHDDANLVPAQGIVSANLSRLNLLATPHGALKTQYMLFAYFDGAVQSLDGGSADVDLPMTTQGRDQVNTQKDIESQTDDAASTSKARRRKKGPAPPPPAPKIQKSQRKGDRNASQQSKSRQNEVSTLTRLFGLVGGGPPKGTERGKSQRQQASRKSPVRSKKTTKTSDSARAPWRRRSRSLGFAEILDIGKRKPLTVEQLARQREVQKPRKAAFDSDHPGGFIKIPVSGEGELCAWRALEASWNAAIPRIARATKLPEASLKGMVTVRSLHATFARDRRNLGPVGIVADRNFTVDHAARVFNLLVKRRTALEMEVGWVGPLQQSAFGGSDQDLAYVLLGAPNEAQDTSTSIICRVWIWNNNEPQAGHYDAIGDAPEADPTSEGESAR